MTIIVSNLRRGTERKLRELSFSHEFLGVGCGVCFRETGVEIEIPPERAEEFDSFFRVVEGGWALELQE
jgi:hypothetical protein